MGGIWVRSQNREGLFNVKAVTYQEEDLFGNKNKIIGWVASECFFVIGKYATKERALQVMDDIQQFVIAKEKADLGGLNVHEVPRIYQMPET